MGRSVSYATGARVVTFKHFGFETYGECRSCGADYSGCAYEQDNGEPQPRCPSCDKFVARITPAEDFDQIVEDFQQYLPELFPSVTSCDEWLGREDHALAENQLVYFGISEYCGLVSYWIVAKDWDGYGADPEPLANRWIDQIADKFIAAFGELTKVGSMSNGEGVYRQIRS